MNFPSDITKPFFSYGIFRPGEIAFHLIAEFVDLEKIEIKIIQGSLKLRDGIVLYDSGSDLVEGYLLFFKEGMERDAYQRIIDMEPGQIYMWNQDKSKYRNEFNILFGKTIGKGIDDEKSATDPIVWKSRFDSSWNDPFIINGFKMLDDFAAEENLISETSTGIKWQEENYFNQYLKFQMLYLFLSSILERMIFLNGDFRKEEKNSQVLKFANDPTLKKSLELIIEENKFEHFRKEWTRVIHKTNDPSSKVEWKHLPDVSIDSKTAMLYYYQLRSNITHRGKSGMHKFSELESSYYELSFILKTFWKMKESEAKALKENIDELIIKRNESN
jgi:hypothetical protein